MIQHNECETHKIKIQSHSNLKQLFSSQRQRILPQIHSNCNMISYQNGARNFTRRQSFQGTQMINRLCKSKLLNQSYSLNDKLQSSLLSTQILDNASSIDDNCQLNNQSCMSNSNPFIENRQMILKNLHDIDEIIMEVQDIQQSNNISLIDLSINIKNNIQHLNEYDEKIKMIDYQLHINTKKLEEIQYQWGLYVEVVNIFLQSSEENNRDKPRKRYEPNT